MGKFDSPLLNEGIRKYYKILHKGTVHHLKYDNNRRPRVLNPCIRENMPFTSIFNIIMKE